MRDIVNRKHLSSGLSRHFLVYDKMNAPSKFTNYIEYNTDGHLLQFICTRANIIYWLSLFLGFQRPLSMSS